MKQKFQIMKISKKIGHVDMLICILRIKLFVNCVQMSKFHKKEKHGNVCTMISLIKVMESANHVIKNT